LFGRNRHPFDESGLVRDIEKIESIKQDARTFEMHVIVVEARRNELAIEVHNACVWPYVPFDHVVRADVNNLVVTNSDCLSPWITIVHGPDDPAPQYEVRILCTHRGNEKQERQQGKTNSGR
jgi:hypothetical protein